MLEGSLSVTRALWVRGASRSQAWMTQWAGGSWVLGGHAVGLDRSSGAR